MSSARMITTFGGPGGGVGDGTAATRGDGGAVGELPPQAVVRARAEARRKAGRRGFMDETMILADPVAAVSGALPTSRHPSQRARSRASLTTASSPHKK